MGVLRQKCVLSYDTFVNHTNYTNSGLNTSFEFYLQEMNNTGNRRLVKHLPFFDLCLFAVLQITGIKKTMHTYSVATPVAVDAVLTATFA